MHPELKKLLQIQELDGEIFKTQSELERYPALRKAHQDEVRRIAVRLEAAIEKRRQLELKIRASESAVKQLRQELKKFDEQLSAVKNQKEYEAINQEIAKSKEKVSQEDEKGLEHILEEEKLDAEIKEQQTSLELRKRESDHEIARLSEREGEKGGLLKRLQNERARLAEAVDPATLRRYDRLNDKTPGNSIVPVEAGKCGGCHMLVQSRTIQDAQRDETLTECTSCHRFLYIS
jgi:predicted  nucleic acid-binding Zn-ribbon protein